MALVLALLLLPPAAALLLVEASAWLGARPREVALQVCTGSLVALASLSAIRDVFGPTPWAPLSGAAVIGASAGLALRVAAVRHFFIALAAAPLAFALIFFASPGIDTLMTAEPPPAATKPLVLGDPPPIVMIVFDELPTISLLDVNGRIDDVRYPAFGRLAEDATWFRNASAVHYKTSHALPALLTGRYPVADKLPIAVDHPENLFAWLSGTYEMRVVESLTRLFAGSAIEDPLQPARLAEDLAIVWLHVVLPQSLSQPLPPISQTWKGFADKAGLDASAPTLQREQEEDDALFREGHLDPARRAELFGDRHGRFLRFVDGIEPSEEPAFHFLHILLPHRPWRYLPSGRAYTPTEDLGLQKGPWAPQEWWAVDGYQKHLLQLDFTDKLLGALLDRLRETELYDRALVVVMSDHGVGFWPGENRRYPEMPHPADVLGTPLFIKLPGQQQGTASDRNVETIDVAPTIADVLGVPLPWRADGCSALSTACPERSEKRMHTHRGTVFRFGPRIDLQGESLERKIRLFGSRSRAHERSAWGPFGSLAGRALVDLEVAEESEARISLPRATFQATARDPQSFASARITGTLRGTSRTGDVDLALVVDGRIRAVTVAQRSGTSNAAEENSEWRFSAFLRESVLDRPGAQLAIYTLEGSATAPRLRHAPIRLH